MSETEHDKEAMQFPTHEPEIVCKFDLYARPESKINYDSTKLVLQRRQKPHNIRHTDKNGAHISGLLERPRHKIQNMWILTCLIRGFPLLAL